MKIIFLIVFTFSYVISLFSQEKSVQKLEHAFGKERIAFLHTNYPDSIEYYKFILENGYRISKKQVLSNEEIAKATPIELKKEYLLDDKINFDKFNIFLLPVYFHENENSYYSIIGTEYIIVLRSKNYLNKKFLAKPK